MEELTIREASGHDAGQIAGLLKELGYANTPSFAQQKLKSLSQSDRDIVLVAERESTVVGVAHLHLAELFHETGSLGRIMALVVTDDLRQAGVGTRLMRSLEALARRAGCVKMEVTSGAQRHGAHEFYQKLGYVEEPKRFVKMLS
jgi:N-acetylglutamate synthase-like GNAT family acetyltransferase